MSSERFKKSTTEGLLAAWRSAGQRTEQECNETWRKNTSSPLTERWRKANPDTAKATGNEQELAEKLRRLAETDPEAHAAVLKALDGDASSGEDIWNA
ncbi:hypothetical protein [Lysobacter sp. GCM10012299]|uniref:hypothetical protein n=1 Tax=Lysobacter sp. GCM10012299 TaxID=3317333 RepID=UPI003610D04B